ncbi:MAG: DUF1738 domain-containing protein [Phycisphaerales bacterium]|nr:DUF1738 domain-containing protein [Phycisphaerales bacterium]
MALDIYRAVTNRILELLDQELVPWRQPIRVAGGGMPSNLVTKMPYRGVNVFLLGMTAWAEGYGSSHWLTFRQARERGGYVRQGERGSLVIFWKQHATTDRETNEPVNIPVLRHYRVFNTDQCEGLSKEAEEPETMKPFEPITEAKSIVEGYKAPPDIKHGGHRAFYRPSDDLIRVPEPERFVNSESYYATLFHELAHSTGHRSRLDRGLEHAGRTLADDAYSKEELIAEMGAAFLAAAAGISPPTIEQSASYIENWSRRLRGDKKLVVQAAGAGQRAADWILGQHGHTEAIRDIASPVPSTRVHD